MNYAGSPNGSCWDLVAYLQHMMILIIVFNDCDTLYYPQRYIVCFRDGRFTKYCRYILQYLSAWVPVHHLPVRYFFKPNQPVIINSSEMCGSDSWSVITPPHSEKKKKSQQSRCALVTDWEVHLYLTRLLTFTLTDENPLLSVHHFCFLRFPSVVSKTGIRQWWVERSVSLMQCPTLLCFYHAGSYYVWVRIA